MSIWMAGPEMTDRLAVRKTYKLYVGGAFPRSESGRTYAVKDASGQLLAHAVRGSRKDARDAVKAARSAQSGWASRTGYNRGQILYRIAEVMETRRSEFVEELEATGIAPEAAADEVGTAIDRLVWYAGWTDKYPQVLGGSNPVSGAFFNFTVPEPVGIVVVAAPDEAPLLALVSRIAPALVAGSTVIALASETAPLVAITFAEALATSDVPAGVVNILTGFRSEMIPALAGHGDVDSLDLTGCDQDLLIEAEIAASESVTRTTAATVPERDWLSATAQSPYLIERFCEYKTVWHPKGR
jgi:acyl-CoA reductase-like NAD-dependent aldehyde dehydrogenase